MNPTDPFAQVLLEHPAVAAHLPAGGTAPTDPALRLARAMLTAVRPVREAAITADPLGVELAADLLVVVEAALVAAATAAAPDTTPAVRALTAWRVHRDAAGAVGGVLALLGPEDRGAVAALADEVRRHPGDTVRLARDARREVLDRPGLDAVLAEIEASTPARTPDYLAPAATAVRELVPVLRDVVEEDYRLDDEGVDAGLAYLLDPLSACHTGALLVAHAARRLADGDARAATVARRWCYARVRSTTLEGLSPRHLAKSRQLVAGGPVVVESGTPA
ncbi:hypothetical protein K7640_02180 [Micromonospora sp. PLK6-60]|uniref:hypothetical protein n=1 Tax=Micromonospora sp. PLK6-60 TaxID=2873383 RepID=UPI001CA71E50|nr:hypothetical protein [Micromonospora sp. PLK6-60]MBY8870648.1 hypothetical protein [Micromonospora sp. PLK6-60]